MTTTMENKYRAVSVPSAAAIIGALGAIPFVAIAAANILDFPLPLADPMAVEGAARIDAVRSTRIGLIAGPHGDAREKPTPN